MSAWNDITIEDATADLTISRIFERWPVLGPRGPLDEMYSDDSRVRGGDLTIGGRSSFTDKLEAALYELSAAHPEVTITWEVVWRGGEPGAHADVIRAGKLVPEESFVERMVPVLLPELIEAANAALDSQVKAVHENGTITYPVDDALRALLDALQTKAAA
ncbi:hypothetical protein ACFVAJ_19065 [Agromyces sp. NPDC057679]|uniref:hypothetical protein n=1 Tax=Agromyces sp. NPDC057679 TaxID=3346207 RepID=UPI00366C3FBC